MLFVTSGFLVTASLLGRQNLIAYLWACWSSPSSSLRLH